MKIIYVTGNMQKVADARARLDQHGMSVEQQKVNTLEIQSDSIAEIARHKAQQAYEIIGKPLVVNDAGWIIPALKGFPGPYMRYINEWLTASDLLALMKDKSDRSIVLKEVLVYHDGKKISVFEKDTFGTIVESPRGTDPSRPGRTRTAPCDVSAPPARARARRRLPTSACCTAWCGRPSAAPSR